MSTTVQPGGRAPTPDTTRQVARGIAHGALLIAVLTVCARVAGFGRQLVFARTVGPTCVGSTYQTANTVPNILYEIAAGGALASLVVPLLAAGVSAGDRARVRHTASALLTWTVLLLAPLALAVAIFARPVVGLLLGGTTCAGAVNLGARMLVVFAPQIVLYGVGIVLAGVLQAHERFAGPALAPLLSSLVVIGAYLTYRLEAGFSSSIAGLGRGAELTLSIGTTLGVAVLSLSLLVPLRRTGLRLVPTLRFPPGAARRARQLAAAGVAALIAQQVSVAIALRLANERTAGGTVVVYALAQTVFLVPWAVLAVPLATAAFPRLSTAAQDGDAAGYRRTTGQVTRAVVAVSVVAMAMLIAAAWPVARLLVEGVGRHADVGALAQGIVAFAPGLVGYGLLALLSRALYARHDARVPAACTVAGWLVVVVADVVLSDLLPTGDRVLALALGNTIGMTVAALLLAAGVLHRTGAGTLAGLPRTAGVALVAAAAGGTVGRLVADALPGSGAGAAVGQSAAVMTVTLLVAGGVFAVLARDDVRMVLRYRRAGG
jgi:putative peptidoglycan lipid II flippase